MPLVFFPTFRIDQDVIKKYNKKLIEIRSEHSIHEIHECSWCIGQAKRHNQEFIVRLPAGSKCGFWNIFFSNLQLMIARSQIYFRINSSLLRLADRIDHRFVSGYLFFTVAWLSCR